jgi:hypothetical protein
MNVAEEAARIRRWAETAGIYSQGRSAGVIQQRDQLGAGTMFSAQAENTFVRKPITAVGFAASERSDHRVFIYTRRKLTAIEQKSLQSSTKANAKLEFRVAQPFSVSVPTGVAAIPLGLRHDRITCGSSISVGNNREAGTLGALLRDKKGTLYGLSCNHVTGGCSNARIGLPIVAPGILDVGSDAAVPRTIGRHQRALQFIAGDPSSVVNFHDNADAAIFSIEDEVRHSTWQSDVADTPSLVASPEEDMPVEKVGRTTGHTTGVIESQLSGAVRIDYKMTAYHSAEENTNFAGSIFYQPVYIIRGKGQGFAGEGDSGALVFSREEAKTSVSVGLVIGGDPTNDVTYMLPLKPILMKFDCALVSGVE